MPDERQRYYVATMPTREHPDLAFVAVDAERDGPSAWYITDDPTKAFDFAYKREAELVVSILEGKHTGEEVTYMLVDPEKRGWHVTGGVPSSCS